MRIPIDWHSAESCLRLVRFLLFLSLTISSAQNIFNRIAFGPNGLFAWPLMKNAFHEKWLESPTLDIVFGKTGFILLNLLRIALLFAGFMDYALPLVLPGLLVVSAVLYLRAFLAMAGADQFNTILLFLLTPCTLFPSPALQAISLVAIAGQVIICYFSNGLVKALAPGWWDGSHLKTLLQTGNFSRKWAARFAAVTDTSIFRLLGSMIVIWELSAVLALFLPLPLLWAYLGIGILFHLINAVVMGLNTFFWSFVSSYPAILFSWHLMDQAVRSFN
jgi:hypothetical protein